MTIRSYYFGVQSFHVENCRSKGDHNDGDTLAVVVTSNKTVFPPRQISLGDNLHAGDNSFQKLVGPFDIDDSTLVTVTYTVLNNMSGSDATEAALKIGGAVISVIGGLEAGHFLGFDSQVEAAITSAIGGVLTSIGEALGFGDSNPDCSGPVASRTVPFLPGQLSDVAQTLGPVTETQRSPSECGNDPHSTIVYVAEPVQQGWRACNRCQGLFFGPFKGVCPAGGQHDETNSFSYSTAFGVAPAPQLQTGWRACNRCQGLFFGPFKGTCPAGGPHSDTGSFDYSVIFGVGPGPQAQNGWRSCNRCQGLFFGPFKGTCPAGGQHDETNSFDYSMQFAGPQ